MFYFGETIHNMANLLLPTPSVAAFMHLTWDSLRGMHFTCLLYEETWEQFLPSIHKLGKEFAARSV